MGHRTTPAFASFDDYRPTVTIAVIIRWILLVSWLALINYRTDQDITNLAFNLLGVGLAALNGYMTWRILTHRPIFWPHAAVLSLADMIVISAGLALQGGLQNSFYIFYYPALLGFSLMFPRRASFGMAALVSAVYVVIAFTVEPKLSLARNEEKELAVRLINMTGIVAAGTLITSWERRRRREAVNAERQRSEENLELERRAQQAELSALEERSRVAREIHDGIAQSIYMLSISLEACADLASRGQDGLEPRLTSLVALSKQALLDTRHYIFDLKPLLAGDSSLEQLLGRQLEEFGAITSLETTLSVEGEEAPLPLATGAGVYRIVQEALSNVFKHAKASEVAVRLRSDAAETVLEICDDGRGFQVSATRSGYGLGNMTLRARELGGLLEVDSQPGRGTRLKLTIPRSANQPSPSYSESGE